MRSARRASPPRRPDPPAIPRSTLQHPTCGRLQKPPVGSQSFAHSFADLSLPPITSRATPHLGSKITIVRTAMSQAGMIARVWRGVYLVPPRLPLGGKWSPGEFLALDTLMATVGAKYQVCGPNAFNRYGFDEIGR